MIDDKPVVRRTSPEIVVVGGGKGGVGKTCLSANMAVDIARKGWRVILVDADLSCSNIELVLGVRTEMKLDDFFHQKGAKSLTPLLCETPYDNLSIIPGSSGLLNMANPKYQQKIAFIRELRKLDADLIIIDLDAGSHLNTLDFFLLSEANGILVITPEKTSIDNAFKFLRSALFRKIERFYKSAEVARLLQQNETLEGFLQSIRTKTDLDDNLKRQLITEMIGLAKAIRPKIVVNRARNSYEAELAANILAKNARQHLMIEPQKLGHILFDKIVPEAVNSGIPYIVSHPQLKISGCISKIANHLGYV